MSTGQGDYFAFDNMTIGSLEQVVPPAPAPEPASTMGLLAFGAFGAGSLLKRKQTPKV